MEHFITKYEVGNIIGARRVALEDSIMQKDRLTTSGSKNLENFISPLDATVIEHIKEAGMKIIGKTKMDEFGISDTLVNVSKRMTADAEFRNDEDKTQSHQKETTATTISGAVSAVAEGIADIALCNDYTGGISQQAAANDLYYIHPTYGTVSRYGLIPSVLSMDQIGIVCKTLEEGQRVLETISKYDNRDGVMRENSETVKIPLRGGVARSAGVVTTNSEFGIRNSELRVGIPKDFSTDNALMTSISELIKDCETIEIELPYYDVYEQVMQILCFGDLNSNLSRYDGIKFGYRASGYNDLQELYTKTRTEAFGYNAKLAIIMGAMVLSNENYTLLYDKTMRVRRLIKETLDFGKYDMIALPSCYNTTQNQLGMLALPRLCGLPAITTPKSKGGITLIADANQEKLLFAAMGIGNATNEQADSMAKDEKPKYSIYVDPTGL